MSCTDEDPCLAPMLRWVHSKTCQDRTRRPKPPPLTRDEALAMVIQCARVCAMEGATRPDRWRLDDALRAYDRASPSPETRTAAAPETRTGEGAGCRSDGTDVGKATCDCPEHVRSQSPREGTP